MTVNLLTLAIHFLGQQGAEDRADTYFQQHLLQDPSAEEGEEEPEPPLGP